MMDRKTVLLILFITMLIGPATAQSENHSEIRGTLQDAEKDIQEMREAGIPTERVESLLTTANRSFRAQKGLAEEEGQGDFSRVRELTGNIGEIRETSLMVNDRLNALEKRIQDLESSNLNLTGVKQAFQEVNTTFHNQRFEEAESQVENVYSEISEAQSVQTQVQAFASAQQESLIGLYDRTRGYAAENWKMLSVAGLSGLVILWILFREYRLWRLEIKREDMIEKKEVIENMIEQAQQEYYVKGKGSKIAFETRMDKFQEMKRDTEEEINELESKLQGLKGVPVISPEIRDRSEEFEQEGEIMDESKEVKESPDRISEIRENGKGEENTLEVKEKYRKIVSQDTVDEAKEEIEGLEDPEYGELLTAEIAGKDRKTLKDYLKDNLTISEDDLEDVEVDERSREIVEKDTVKHAKEEIEDLEDPDHRALLKAEIEGKDRKTLKEYLKEQIRFE